MTDLTDDHFLENIRQNPGDDLARGIYADWLEEQGNPKAVLIRLFQQAAQGDRDALSRLKLQISGQRQGFLQELYDLFDSTTQVRIQVEFAFQSDPSIRSSPGSMHLLRAFWEHSANPSRSWETLDHAYEAHLPNRLHINAYMLYWCYFDEEQGDLASWCRRNARDPQAAAAMQDLIVISYYLFGTNVLPDSFERTGLLR